jgi:hypothetical protein
MTDLRDEAGTTQSLYEGAFRAHSEAFDKVTKRLSDGVQPTQDELLNEERTRTALANPTVCVPDRAYCWSGLRTIRISLHD